MRLSLIADKEGTKAAPATSSSPAFYAKVGAALSVPAIKYFKAFEDDQPRSQNTIIAYALSGDSRVHQRQFVEANMEVDMSEEFTGFKDHFNGAVPIKRARMDLTTTTTEAAQIRKRKEAEKAYGRGRKIPGKSQARPLSRFSS